MNNAITCLPRGAAVVPDRMALTGASLTFCFAAPIDAGGSAENPYCFTADLETKTIAATTAPTGDRRIRRHRLYDPAGGSIEPSAHGTGLTVCTSDKATCHDLAIDPASLGDKPVAVSDDAAFVAIDTRSYGPSATQRSPGRLETWDAVAGKKLASFEIAYGPDRFGSDHSAGRVLQFLGDTVIAFTESPCALPCSSATMYSVRGTYLGLLASDPTASSAERFHDDLFVLHEFRPGGPFVVQDIATGKTVQLDPDPDWDAVVTPERIVRVVGSGSFEAAARPARVEVWGPDLTMVTAIAVPTCVAVPLRSSIVRVWR
jgi:hypothetical protein